MHPDHEQQQCQPSFWRSRYAVGLLVIGAVAGYFLLTEHLAHVASILPYLLVLACPLMHLFMHHGHGAHTPQHGAPADNNTQAGKPEEPL